MKTLILLTIVLVSLPTPLFAGEGIPELPPLPPHISAIITEEHVEIFKRCAPGENGIGMVRLFARTNETKIVYHAELLALVGGDSCVLLPIDEYILLKLLWLVPNEKEMRAWTNDALLQLLLQPQEPEKEKEKKKTKFRL